MTDKALKLLGLMRPAGAIEIGADRAAEAARAGKARVLLLAADSTETAVDPELEALLQPDEEMPEEATPEEPEEATEAEAPLGGF